MWIKTLFWVRIIFDKYLVLQTLNSVKNHLNNHNIPSKKGLKWSVKVVRDVLSKVIYTGHYYVKEIEIKDENLRIIDNNTFQKVQELLKDRAKFRPNQNSNSDYREFESIHFNYSLKCLPQSLHSYI